MTVRLKDADTGNALGMGVYLRPITPYATGGAKSSGGNKGETVFLNLEAGDYILEADSQDAAPNFDKPESEERIAHPKAYGPFWYPGVPELSMAQQMHRENRERYVVDFPVGRVNLGTEQMNLTVHIPDEIAGTLSAGGVLARRVLKASLLRNTSRNASRRHSCAVCWALRPVTNSTSF